MTERRRLVAPMAVGLALIGAGGWVLTGAGADAAPRRAPVALDLSAVGSPTTTAPVAPTDRRASSGVPVAPVGTRDALLADDVAVPTVSPTHIGIERVGASAAVAAVGVDARDEVAVPSDVTQAGWYRFGPAPGSDGSAVIVAHVDYDGRPGPFFRLADVAAGHVVTVGFSDGSTRRFAVTQTGSYRKEHLPTAALFRTDGPPQLVLITCGGDFRSDRRSYADNIVVLASPLG